MSKLNCLLTAAALSVVPVLSPAATLTNVPMQGGMLMPIISYHASDGMIHVMMPMIRVFNPPHTDLWNPSLAQ